MPELPEVETVRRGLVPWLEGERLCAVAARRPDLRFPLPPRFAETLTGRTVTRLERRAKYLLMHLDDGRVWLSHLGMSGKYRVQTGAVASALSSGCHPGGSRDLPGTRYGVPSAGDPGFRRDDSLGREGRFSQQSGGKRERGTGAQDATTAPDKHDHILITTARATIVYYDPRRFGFMDLIAPDALTTHPLLAPLGPEPLGNSFHEAYLAARARTSRAPLKAWLLDQKVVAGLGNIYVAEALFRARLHPERLACTLTADEAARLTRAVRTVLRDAIAAGGSSLRDYQGPAGEFGCFQHTFAVYGRDGEPCRSCAAPIQRIVQSGRATCFCPVCQG